MSLPILSRARVAIHELKAYSSARSLHKAEEGTVFLDANEMPFDPVPGHAYARYAPQQPPALMDALSKLYNVPADQILVSRGADEAIDVLVRVFCETGQDSVLICPPAFPMYAQAARIQGAEIVSVPLDENFVVRPDAIFKAVTDKTKIVFVCSPNNPTGNLIQADAVENLCKELKDRALVVVDEAYIEFCIEHTTTPLLKKYDNLVVLRTLSKGYALAGVRCGVMLAHPEIVALCRKVLAPYPLPVPVVEVVLKTLKPENLRRLEKLRAEILKTREEVAAKLVKLPAVEKVYPSDANFLLVRFKNAAEIMRLCSENGFVLRDQSHQPGLTNCIRFSMGTAEEMDALIQLLATGKKPERTSTRRARVTRTTNETAIMAIVDLDRTSPVHIHTGVGFYDHMLEQVAKHAGFSLVLDCVGDLHIDPHHTIEDCAIALGQALKQVLGDKAGIGRYGFTLPMDEALASCAIDLSGRAFLKFEGVFPESKVGDMPTDMVAHVFRSIAENMQATVHISVTGENAHHMVEGCFKAFGRALRPALKKEGDALPSTKGTL